MNRMTGKRARWRAAFAVLLIVTGCLGSCGDSGSGVLLTEERPQALAAETGTEVRASAAETQALTAGGKAEMPDSIAAEGDGTRTSKGAEAQSQAVAVEMEPETEAQTPPSEAETAVPSASCYVYVCGQVVSPGVYRLEEGQRIFEAIAMAGGFTGEAAENYLNLAEPVWDGMKLEVPGKDQVPESTWPAAGDGVAADERPAGGMGTTFTGKPSPGQKNQPGANPPSSGLINLNTATREELMTLRGIGEVRADQILRYRQEHGAFGRKEDIMNVPGIKEGAYQKIKEDITV